MAKKAKRIRNGLWRASKWLFALLIIAYVGWLMGLGPKSYRSALSYVIPAYFSDPDPECRVRPTPECLVEMAEQSTHDIYDYSGNVPLNAEFVGMLYARLGNFDRADQLATWIEEHRYWEPQDDRYEGSVTHYYDSKIEYLVGAGKWREALAMVIEVGAADSHSRCDGLQNIAVGRALEGAQDEAVDVLAQMAKSGCPESDDSDYDRHASLADTRRTIEMLLLLHLPRDEAARHPDYQEALWAWLSAPQENRWIFRKTPPGFTDYCDVLTSVDHNAILEEWQLRTLLLDFLNAGAMPRAKEVLERIVSRPNETKWLLKWLRDTSGDGFYIGGTATRFIADNYLTEDERRLIAPRVAEEASGRLDEETIDWARSYLSTTEYENAKNEFESNWQDDSALMSRQMIIHRKYRHDRSKMVEALNALSREYTWRWYHVPLPDFGARWFRIYDQRSGIITSLFRYGEYEEGFHLIQELAYGPGALTAAAWGLKYQGPISCGSPN